ncbi:transglutaminase-like domain-containing protein [Demequina sp.]|uniref:transglutaminase-like domain-containing protein n=1 Tax=Demequina sp. TaxID=2050685 RepID=UPI0025C42C78|nr:transglutaminase-like domain-containing protein [Demequina sp.]
MTRASQGGMPDPRRAGVDLAAIVVMLAMGAWGFGPVFASTAWLPAAVGGIVIGVGLGVVAVWRRWPVIVAVAAMIGAYVIFGGALALRSTTIAGVVPSLDTVSGLAFGAVRAWKALLTVDVPTVGFETVLLVPFISTLVASLAATLLALRTRRAAWAVIPVLALLGVSIGFGLYRAAAPLAQGAVLATVAIAWLAWRRHRERAAGGEALAAGHSAETLATSRRRRAYGGVGMLLGALAVGAGTVAVAAPQQDRNLLREEVVPPLELHDYASPLQSFRKWVRDYEDEPLFTVDHLPQDGRVRLATLDAYDGVVYAVSGNGSSTGGSFARVGSGFAADVEGEPESFTITVDSLSGVWVPTVGAVTSVSFSGDQAESLNRALHHNAATGTLVETYGVGTGVTYEFSAVVDGQPSVERLESASFARLAPPAIAQSPEVARTMAADVVADAGGPYGQARALADHLSGAGFFSHGLEGQAPSRSGHRAERIAELLAAEQMIGDDEQYAVAYALMAHELGIPVRVVVGFYPDTYSEGVFEATGATAHVWAEVAFDGLGWVVIDPSPAEDQAPVNEEQEPQREPKPRVLQPPPPPAPPAEVPPSLPTEDEVVEDTTVDVEALVRTALVVLAFAGGSAILWGPLAWILIAKARRRRRRRRSGASWDRLNGAWMEVADLAADYRVTVPAHATRVEGARMVDHGFEHASTLALAARADRGVWAPGEPTDDEVAEYWADVATAMRSMHRSRPFTARVTARMSLRSLAQRRAQAREDARRSRRTRT